MKLRSILLAGVLAIVGFVLSAAALPTTAASAASVPAGIATVPAGPIDCEVVVARDAGGWYVVGVVQRDTCPITAGGALHIPPDLVELATLLLRSTVGTGCVATGTGSGDDWVGAYVGDKEACVFYVLAVGRAPDVIEPGGAG